MVSVKNVHGSLLCPSVPPHTCAFLVDLSLPCELLRLDTATCAFRHATGGNNYKGHMSKPKASIILVSYEKGVLFYTYLVYPTNII